MFNHLGRHVVSDAELQVSDDALHAVVGLLARRTQVLLHGSCHWGEDGLGRLSRVHHLTGVLGRRCGLIVLKSFDMSERFLYCHHQSGRRKRNYEQMFSTDKRFNLRVRNLRIACRYMKERFFLCYVRFTHICDFIKNYVFWSVFQDSDLALRFRILRSISASS